MNLTRKLLTMDMTKYNEVRTGTVIVPNLSASLGEEAVVDIKQVDDDRMNELSCMILNDDGTVNFEGVRNQMAILCTEGVTEPNLADEELQKYYGASDPADLAKRLFKGDDLQIVSDAITNLSNAAKVNNTKETKKK